MEESEIPGYSQLCSESEVSLGYTRSCLKIIIQGYEAECKALDTLATKSSLSVFKNKKFMHVLKVNSANQRPMVNSPIVLDKIQSQHSKWNHRRVFASLGILDGKNTGLAWRGSMVGLE